MGETVTEALSINVLAVAPGPLVISTGSLPSGATGCPYTNQLQATGGIASAVLDARALVQSIAAGLTLGSSGTVSGEPTTNNAIKKLMACQRFRRTNQQS